jgi:hypothetical protein
MNVFRILVYAIVAFAVIAFILLYLAPLFFPSESPLELMDIQLDKAELRLGSFASETINYSSGSLIQARNLDSSSRSLRFQCTDGSLCCGLGEDCGRIEWDERKVKFNQSAGVRTHFRCVYEAGIASCTIYFGKAPAQVELLNLPGQAEKVLFDLKTKEPVISFQVTNTGDEDMLNPIQISYEITKDDDFQFEGSMEVNALKKGESQPVTLNLDKTRFLEIGEHIMTVKAEAMEAGFDEAPIGIHIAGMPEESCVTTTEGNLQWIDAGCIKKYFCSDCRLALSCDEAWEKKFDIELCNPPPGVDSGCTTEFAIEYFPHLSEDQCQ